MPGDVPERGTFAADFRVGEWLVEPSLDRLSRNGTVLRLRPQLTNLLVVLARHGGRTVSKDEILATVWEGQFVAESGMTRCIAEIRQALGDDAREPTIIETIPKRGYRLLAPVVFLADEQAPVAGAGPRPVERQVRRAEGEAPGGGRAGQEGGGVPAVEADPQDLRQPDTLLPAAHVRRGAGSWILRGVIGAALLVGLTWGAIGWAPAPVLSDRDTVLLADVTNSTGDPAFDQTLRLALAVHLGQAPFLRLLPNERVRTALRLMGRTHATPVTGAVALEVCRREGAAVLLAGSIARLGTHYAVGLEAVACKSGESVGRQLIEAESKDRVLSALGTAAARLRRTLGESRASLLEHDVPIVEATTPSLEALKALSLGDIARDHSRHDEALTFYRRATELDPQFALAWARRGAAARNVGHAAGEEVFAASDEPSLAFTKAYELRERVSDPERFYILSHYYRFVLGDPGKALETYRLWKQTYPGSSTPLVNMAALLNNTYGQYEAALPDAREAAALSPYSSITTKALAVACLGTGRLAEARQVLRRAATQGSADLIWRRLAFQVAFGDGDSNTMRELAAKASGDAAATLVMKQLAALAAASRGRLREARQLWTEASAGAQEESALNRATIILTGAQAEALLGDAPSARRAAEEALRLDRHPATLLSAAIVLALAGDGGKAQPLIDEAVRHPKPGISSRWVWEPVARALVEAGAGRHPQALETLRNVGPFERGRDFDLAPLAVRALVELWAGRAPEAAATFAEVIRLRDVVSTSPWIPFARLGRGRALRTAGDAQGCAAAYDELLEWVKGADTDAPLLATALRERAACGRSQPAQ